MQEQEPAESVRPRGIVLDWARPALRTEYERFTGKRAEGQGWSQALMIWDALQSEVCEGNTAFVDHLSTSQRNSLRLLVDFWTAQYVHESVPKVLRRAMVLQAAGSPMEEIDQQQPVVSAFDDYSTAMYQLFGFEFLGADKSDQAVQDERSAAARTAACQRIAFETYRQHAPEELVQSQLANNLYRSQAQLADDHNLGATLAYLQRSDNDLPVGGTIEACPWLTEGKRKGLPHYLWDIHQRRTVKVEDLSSEVTYMFVSHTWGRWKRSEVPYASIPGVPWPVPRNTRFDVESMPEALESQAEMFMPARYVWLDLFCIPQDRSPLAKQEIANQAAIVGRAYRAVAWLNYVEDWSGLSFALQYLASFWLDSESLDGESIGHIIRCALRRNSHPSNGRLWSGYSHNNDVLKPHFHEFESSDGWFTSLWTLQELYLRPDMLLCDRNWEILKMPSGMPLTFDTMLAVNWCARGRVNTEESNQHLEDLLVLLLCSGLDPLLNPNPLGPLLLGSRRHCSERRAEAIMSVIGATDWYKEVTDPEQHLVVNQYAVEFLREVQSLTGGLLFYNLLELSCFDNVLLRRDDGIIQLAVAGTMFPFDAREPDSKSLLWWGTPDSRDHSSVASWWIADDGRVMMPEVGIVASTEPELDGGLDQTLVADVILPSSDSRECQMETDANLHQRLRDLAPFFMKHAICIRESGRGICEGVILMEIKTDPHDDAPTRYAKFGDFRISKPDQIQDVETWEVGEWEVY